MYTGHVALALGARALRQDVPLWALVVAAQGCDWAELALRPLAGQEAAEFWSHAYPYVVLTAAALALLATLLCRSAGAGLMVALLYLSHPAGDYVTGYKVLWEGGSRVGMSVVERPLQDFLLQAVMCVGAWMAYLTSLSERRRRQVWVAAPLALLLALQALADVVLGSERLREPFRPMSGDAPPPPVVASR